MLCIPDRLGPASGNRSILRQQRTRQFESPWEKDAKCVPEVRDRGARFWPLPHLLHTQAQAWSSSLRGRGDPIASSSLLPRRPSLGAAISTGPSSKGEIQCPHLSPFHGEPILPG